MVRPGRWSRQQRLPTARPSSRSVPNSRSSAQLTRCWPKHHSNRHPRDLHTRSPRSTPRRGCGRSSSRASSTGASSCAARRSRATAASSSSSSSASATSGFLARLGGRHQGVTALGYARRFNRLAVVELLLAPACSAWQPRCLKTAAPRERPGPRRPRTRTHRVDQGSGRAASRKSKEWATQE